MEKLLVNLRSQIDWFNIGKTGKYNMIVQFTWISWQI